MSVEKQDTKIPLGQYSSEVANLNTEGGEKKDRSKTTIALTYF